jgi:drug/metabolite transporter (DMT)-like permease
LLLVNGGEAVDAWRAASGVQIGGMLAIGAFATVGHLCLVFAFGVAPMATLMPFIYTQIAWALVTSFLAFRHVPDGWAWVGMAVIAACGAASAWLNVRHPQSVVEADTIAD